MLYYVYVLNNVAPRAVEFMNHSRSSNEVTVSWPSPRSLLDGYIISISSESLMKEEILPSTKRYEHIAKKLSIYMKHKINILYVFLKNDVGGLV